MARPRTPPARDRRKPYHQRLAEGALAGASPEDQPLVEAVLYLLLDERLSARAVESVDAT
jgi:hypothetical protein